ncbi:hypothetical protein Cgig2_003836 [Carnegiea gigantea]|uniref:Transposase n=1 Tax=Carnegiea gigantea TaxID=171969 RepID=A0A9Q1JTQ0_9CARY|nr:hypothetical protein Cgig2_003836 [Carnegiea gigantea]
MNSYKALGPNHLNTFFYQKHWAITGDDVVAIVLSILEDLASYSGVEEDRVLAVYYEGAMFAISNVDLDRYQMIELHRDVYVEGRKCGVDVPEYVGFVFCPSGSNRKLPLESDEDWRNLVSLWECNDGKIPIYMLALHTPSMDTISPLPSQPLSSIHHELEATQPELQLPNLSVGMSAYLFSQTISTSQPEVPSLDAINVGLGGLEAYDLRDLSQPRGEFGEGSSNGDGDNDSDESVDPDFNVLDVQEGDGEEGCSESLVDSAENDSNDGSDVNGFENVDAWDEIPRHIDAEGEDDDGNPTKNLWNKMYENGNMWVRNSDGKVSIVVGDMFVDKDQWSKVIRDYAIQESFSLQRIKNDRFRHIAVCKENKIASHLWVAEQLVTNFKANPSMDAGNMQKLIMERSGVSVPRHTCHRAKKLLKSWGLVKAFEDIFPECKRRICDVHYYRNFSTEYPGLTHTSVSSLFTLTHVFSNTYSGHCC